MTLVFHFQQECHSLSCCIETPLYQPHFSWTWG